MTRSQFAELRNFEIGRQYGVRFPGPLTAPREFCGSVDGSRDPKPAKRTLLDACGVSSQYADLHVAEPTEQLQREFRAATVALYLVTALAVAAIWFTRSTS